MARKGWLLKNYALVWGGILTAVLFPLTADAGYKVTVTPKMAVESDYATNINRTETGEVSDVVVVVKPGLVFEMADRVRGFRIDYLPGYSAYMDNSDLNTLRQRLDFSSWIPFSRTTRFTLDNALERSEDPQASGRRAADDPLGRDVTLRQGRNVYLQNSTSAGISFQPTRKLGVTAGYNFSLLENEDPLIEDNRQHVPTVGFSFQQDLFSSYTGDLSYTRGEFSGASDDLDIWNGSVGYTRVFTQHLSGHLQYAHTLTESEGAGDDYQIYDPSAGLTWQIQKDTALTAMVGYYVQDREYAPDESGVTVSGNLGKGWNFKRGAIQFDASSGYDQSFFGAENLGFNTYYGVSAAGSYRITRELTGNAGGNYRLSTYKNEVPEREDKQGTLDVGLTYTPRKKILKGLSISIGYVFDNLDSNDPGSDYTDNRFEFSVSLDRLFEKEYRIE